MGSESTKISDKSDGKKIKGYIECINKQKQEWQKNLIQKKIAQLNEEPHQNEDKINMIEGILIKFSEKNIGSNYINEIREVLSKKYPQQQINTSEQYQNWIQYCSAYDPKQIEMKEKTQPRLRTTEIDITNILQKRNSRNSNNSQKSPLITSEQQSLQLYSHQSSSTQASIAQRGFKLEIKRAQSDKLHSSNRNSDQQLNKGESKLKLQRKVHSLPSFSRQSSYGLKDSVLDPKSMKSDYNQAQVQNIFTYIYKQCKQEDGVMKMIVSIFSEIFYEKYQFCLKEKLNSMPDLTLSFIKDSIQTDLAFITEFLKILLDKLFGSFINDTLKNLNITFRHQEQLHLIIRIMFREKQIYSVTNHVLQLQYYEKSQKYQNNLAKLQNIDISHPFLEMETGFQLNGIENPYLIVINKIKSIKYVPSPIMKFEIIAQLKKDINEYIESLRKNSQNQNQLPITIDIYAYTSIFKYCIIKSQEKNLFNEIQLINDFMPDYIAYALDNASNTFATFYEMIEYLSEEDVKILKDTERQVQDNQMTNLGKNISPKIKSVINEEQDENQEYDNE